MQECIQYKEELEKRRRNVSLDRWRPCGTDDSIRADDDIPAEDLQYLAGMKWVMTQ